MSTADTPTHGPRRTRLIQIMTAVFVVLLVAMLLTGTVLVLTQLVGVAVLSADLVAGVDAVMGPVVFGIAGTLGIWTLLLSYANGWKPSEG